MTATRVDDIGLVLEEDDLLLELVRSIVQHPEKVHIEVTRGRSVTLLTITVDPSDRGHVIGREGRTLHALSHLFSKAAYLDGRKTIIQMDKQERVRSLHQGHRWSR
jgi:hypothetical protein